MRILHKSRPLPLDNHPHTESPFGRATSKCGFGCPGGFHDEGKANVDTVAGEDALDDEPPMLHDGWTETETQIQVEDNKNDGEGNRPSR